MANGGLWGCNIPQSSMTSLVDMRTVTFVGTSLHTSPSCNQKSV